MNILPVKRALHMFLKFFPTNLSFKTFFRYKQYRNSQTPFTHRVVELKEWVKVIALMKNEQVSYLLAHQPLRKGQNLQMSSSYSQWNRGETWEKYINPTPSSKHSGYCRPEANGGIWTYSFSLRLWTIVPGWEVYRPWFWHKLPVYKAYQLSLNC